METASQNPSTNQLLNNTEEKTIREILQMGFTLNDAKQTELQNFPVLLFNTQDKSYYTHESLKQAKTIAQAIAANTIGNPLPQSDMIGKSFSDGTDRLDIKGIDKNRYKVKRLEDHPFLENKKALRGELWLAEDLHASIEADLLSQIQTYNYISKKSPYEFSEIELRSKGLISIQRDENGSNLTFDHPIAKITQNLYGLTPTPETASLIQGEKKENTTSGVTDEQLKRLISSYQEMKEKHPDALLLFRSGDSYVTYLEDAVAASKILDIPLARRNCGMHNGMTEVAEFPHHALDTYLPELIRAGRRVAICDQLEAPKLNTRHSILEENNNKKSDSETQQNLTPKSQQSQQNTDKDSADLLPEIIAKIEQLIGKHRGIALSPEQPIMAQTSKGITFSSTMIMREENGTIRLYGNDNKNKERSVDLNKVDKTVLQQIHTHLKGINQTPLSSSADKQNKPDQDKQKETPKLGSEARKILSLSKIYNATKNTLPNEENMIFVRLRNIQTKRFMYQTFGEDAERLTGKISPTVEIQRPEIRGKQYPNVTLQQEHLANVKTDLMNHNVFPVIINAKGEQIDNDHFLAFTKEDQQSSSTIAADSKQAAVTTSQNQPSSSETVSQASAKTIPNDARIQFDVHANSHVAGMYDIRLYVNGEKAGAHRLTKEDRDNWRDHKVPITVLMRKYFPKELANANLDSLTWIKADKETSNNLATSNTTNNTKELNNTPATQTPSNKNEEAPSALSPKELVYFERSTAHQTISDNLKDDAVVLLQMRNNNGGEFFQTFNKDAEFVAEFLNRKIMTAADTKYISLTTQEVENLKNQIGDNNFIIEKYDQKPSYNQKQSNSLINITPSTRVEYTISPIHRENKDTKQRERIPGMFAIAITADGQDIGRKTLTKDERDLLNTHPGEVTNIINKKFSKELGNITLDYKQVHKPAVTDDQWQMLTLKNGLKFDKVPQMNKNSGKYEMTAFVNGEQLGPKIMYRPDISDFFDHAKPAVEIAANVFRDELKSLASKEDQMNQNHIAMNTSTDDIISLWQSMRYNQENANNPQMIVFIQRDGKYGTYYQTYGEDAKNMSKITNRSLRVIDTENYKNMVHANVPQEQIREITLMLRKNGFQSFAANTDGKIVNINTDQKVKPPKSMALSDGRKVEDISLRNSGGKWLMTANIDGKPLPEREISHKDATVFKRGQQDMSEIVLKYYANDFNTLQQDSPKHSIKR